MLFRLKSIQINTFIKQSKSLREYYIVNLNTYYNHRMPQYILVAAIALIAYSFNSACATSASDKDRVTVNITFNNRKGIVSEIKSDTEIKIKTCVGKLKFPIRSLSKIEMSEVPNLATVHLTSGDRWAAEIDDSFWDELDFDNSEEIRDLLENINSISFSIPQREKSQTPTHFMKLIMEDGSQALINTAKTLLTVDSADSKQQIPIGTLRAIKFITATGHDDPDSVIIRFHTGFVKRMGLGSEKKYIQTSDSYANKIKVYHRDIMGILSATDFEDNAMPAKAAKDSQNIYQINLKNGQTKTIPLPISIWKLKTDAGIIPFSSPMIASLTANSQKNKTHILKTVYGEIFSGKLLIREIITSNNQNKTTNIDIADINEISTDSTTMKIPDRWLVWYLKSGNAMVGSFADSSTGLFINDDLALQPDSVFRLTPTSDGSSFVNITKNGDIAYCKTKSRKVKIALLTTGTTISIPWKDICIVKTQNEVSEKDLLALHVVAANNTDKDDARNDQANDNTNDDWHNHKRNYVNDDNYLDVKTIKLRTSIGTLELEPNVFAKIVIDKSTAKACITSIYNDKLITSIPSKRLLGELQNIDEYELPEEELFEISIRDEKTPKPTRNSFICRLITGDILYGLLPAQELDLKKNESRGAPIKVDISTLQQILRNDEGDLVFNLERGNILATPKQRQLEALLLITGNTNKIGFKQIEFLIVNSTKLPPTTCYHPGMTASLKNEVFVEGGSFMQGSESGMPNETPMHNSSVSSFYMDSTEVTRAQFAAFVRDTRYETLAEQNDSKTTWKTPGFIQRLTDPVVCVSWIDAIEYCNWRSDETDLPKCYTIDKDQLIETDRTAMGYRLPTEAEWEFTARNRGKNNIYAWDSSSTKSPTTLANFQQDNSSQDQWVWTSPVQTFPTNGLGIFGLSGNVWEWCEDLYFDMAYSALKNSQNHNPCITHDTVQGLNRRVMRGGSFKNRLDLLRCTSRGNGQPYAFSSHVGFRCVRNAE